MVQTMSEILLVWVKQVFKFLIPTSLKCNFNFKNHLLISERGPNREVRRLHNTLCLATGPVIGFKTEKTMRTKKGKEVSGDLHLFTQPHCGDFLKGTKCAL